MKKFYINSEKNNPKYKTKTVIRLLLVLCIGVMPLFSFGQSSQTFDTGGTFTVPAGMTSIKVMAWGGGGCSGNNNDSGNPRACGGGGGGAYSGGTLAVTTGDVITITIGAGGTYSATGTGTPSDGGVTTVVLGANTITANGGKRGVIGGNTVTTNGGAGGVASAISGVTTESYAGGNGGNGYVSTDDGGGGGGGAAASISGIGNNGVSGTSGGVGGAGGVGANIGGNGGRGSDNDGTPNSTAGVTPGGGGGGRGDDAGNDNNGGGGRVTLIWCTASTTGYWLGTTSTDWFTASNWCGGVPTASTNVIIPLGTPNQPVVSSAGAVCATLTLGGSGGLLGTVLRIDSPGTLVVSGAITMNTPTTGTTVNSAINVYTGTLTAASINMGIVAAPGYRCRLLMTGNGTINITGDIVMQDAAIKNEIVFTNGFGTGTLNIGGNVVSLRHCHKGL